MLKQTLNNYKLNTGSGFPKLIKAISTIGLSVAMMLSATFGISSCAPEVEAEHPPIVTPGDDENDKDNNDDKTHDNQDDPGKDDDQSKDDQGKDDGQDDGKDDQGKDDQQGGDDDQGKDDDNQGNEDKWTPVLDRAYAKEHFAEIEQQLQTPMEELLYSYDRSWHSPKLLQAYLISGPRSQYIDTIGIVMSANEGNGFLYSELEIFNLQADLTWKDISENGVGLEKYTTKTCNRHTVYGNSSTINTFANYDEKYVGIAFQKAFKLDDFSPLWTGWVCKAGPNDAAHYLTYISGNIIRKAELIIDTTPNGIFNSVITNFIEAQDNSHCSLDVYEPSKLITVVPESWIIGLDTQNTEEENM